jgi:hypothetical protein
MDPATKARFAQRSSAERVNSYLKDNYGGRNIRVKDAAKVMTHLMFGIIAITAILVNLCHQTILKLAQRYIPIKEKLLHNIFLFVTT